MILGSGTSNPAAQEIIERALSPFVHKIHEIQRIDLGGRTIIALTVGLDPAHFEVIVGELERAGADANLDIAIELQ